MSRDHDTTANGRRIRIGLLWHSVNSENLGVTALTISNIDILRQLAEELGVGIEFLVMGWADPGAAQIEADDLAVYRMRTSDIVSPAGLLAQCRSCDMTIDISTGDGFSDIYGAKRFILGTLSRMMALASGRPFVFAPQTIGPFDRRWARWLASWTMKRADAVISRDRLSADYVRDMGVRNVIQSTDVAFRLPYTAAAKKTDGKAAVGINVSGLLFNGGYTRNNMFSLKADFADLARKLVAAFSSRADCEVHLIAHVISEQFEVEDDYRACQILAAEIPGVIVAPKFRDPSAAKSYISGMDFFCGARMHACIAAFSSGVAVVPIAYSRKFAGLFNALGYTHVADCRTQTAGEICAAVVSGFESRHQLEADVAAGLRMAEERLKSYTLEIERLLRKASAGQP